MILKGSQRSGAKALADHLLNERDNDHVAVLEVRGFIADDLLGALREAQAIAKATQCTQYLFSLSLNPPESHIATDAELLDAAERAEEALGLTDQPRAIVIHEKEGCRHAHAVWSRVDAAKLTAINLPHFKRKLMSLSKELFLDHGWDLPNGLKTYGGKNPLNFTLAEWQHAKRQDVDPREIKQMLRRAWDGSDSRQGLMNALGEAGLTLARGDRRSVVVLDHAGAVYSLARWAGVKAKDIKDRVGDLEQLPSINEAKADLYARVSGQMRRHIAEVKARHQQERQPALEDKANLVRSQRDERRFLARAQQARAVREAQARSQRIRRGLIGVWDWVTGKRAALQKQQAAQLEAEQARDAKERHALIQRHVHARRGLLEQFRHLRRRQKTERDLLARQIGRSLKPLRGQDLGIDRDVTPEQTQRQRRRDISLSR